MISKASSKLFIDLRGTPCPVNFVRCKLAIEELSKEESLEVYLDAGEPEQMVVSGLKNEGFHVEITQRNTSWIKLMISSGV